MWYTEPVYNMKPIISTLQMIQCQLAVTVTGTFKGSTRVHIIYAMSHITFYSSLCHHVTFYKTLTSLSTVFIKGHVGFLQFLKWPCHTSFFTHVEPSFISTENPKTPLPVKKCSDVTSASDITGSSHQLCQFSVITKTSPC